MTMTQQELQARLQQEQQKQLSMHIAETKKKEEQQMRVLNQLNSYLPKVNEWLQMLNMIHASGTKMFSLSRQMLCSNCIPKGSWEVLTDGVAHRFGIYGATLYKDFSMCAVPQTFVKMGCEGGGCNGDDVWTDGQNWYHGKVKLTGRIDEISINKARGIITQIQKFETYFNELLETLG